MEKYTDEQLQEHELNFWAGEGDIKNKHLEFYSKFFNFNLLEGKTVLDVGCGGNPVSDFTNVKFSLEILDPIIDKLLNLDKYKHLSNVNGFSHSLLEENVNLHNKYDIITCLNVIDHFADDNLLSIDIFHSYIKKNGELWLYYDIRPEDSCDHLALDNDKIISKIKEKFIIKNISEELNPKHGGWSGVYKSIRIIAEKI
jgi:2-polyprenyl-3-methyl-5-hydroxy-6-metoxy-1,4-benzoquinol methylase